MELQHDFSAKHLHTKIKNMQLSTVHENRTEKDLEVLHF